MKLEEVKKEVLLETIESQQRDIARLLQENREQRGIIRELERYREDTYILMSEAFRYKRMLEILDGEKRSLEDKLAKEKARLEKAERGIRNLQKWMELKGINGGWYSE